MITKNLAGGAFLIAIGIGFFSVFLREILRRTDFRKRARILTGQIIASEKYRSTDSDGNSSYYECPVVRVREGANEETFRVNTGETSRKFQIGQKVRVVATKYDLSDAQIVSYSDSWLISVTFALIGCMFLAGGIAVLILRK